MMMMGDQAKVPGERHLILSSMILRWTGPRSHSPAGANSDGDSLGNTAVVDTGRVHAVIDRKIPTDQIGAHGGVFARHGLGFVDFVGLVLAVVDPNHAGVPCAVFVDFIAWFGPMTAAAEI